MITLQGAFQAAQSSELIARFTAAVWKASTDIVHEDPATPQHAQRIDWAKRALVSNGQAQSYAFIITRLTFSENTTLQDKWMQDNSGISITDGDIQFVVNSYAQLLAVSAV